MDSQLRNSEGKVERDSERYWVSLDSNKNPILLDSLFENSAYSTPILLVIQRMI